MVDLSENKKNRNTIYHKSGNFRESIGHMIFWVSLWPSNLGPSGNVQMSGPQGAQGAQGSRAALKNSTDPWLIKRKEIEDMGVPYIEVPQNGWFIVENPIKINDAGVLEPLVSKGNHPKITLLQLGQGAAHSSQRFLVVLRKSFH